MAGTVTILETTRKMKIANRSRSINKMCFFILGQINTAVI